MSISYLSNIRFCNPLCYTPRTSYIIIRKLSAITLRPHSYVTVRDCTLLYVTVRDARDGQFQDSPTMQTYMIPSLSCFLFYHQIFLFASISYFRFKTIERRVVSCPLCPKDRRLIDFINASKRFSLFRTSRKKDGERGTLRSDFSFILSFFPISRKKERGEETTLKRLQHQLDLIKTIRSSNSQRRFVKTARKSAQAQRGAARPGGEARAVSSERRRQAPRYSRSPPPHQLNGQ